MYDLKIRFLKKDNKMKDFEFSLVWYENLKDYISSFFDTEEYMKVEQKIVNEIVENKYKDCKDLEFDFIREEASKMLFSDFKNIWNKYSDDWECISCMAKVECLNCGKYNYYEILKDGLGKFGYCCHCDSTFDIE